VLHGKAPCRSTVKEALLTIEARVIYEGTERKIGVRVGDYEGAAYVDLANESGEAVRVDAAGQEVVANPQLFRHGRSHRGLRAPMRGGALAELRPFLNVATETIRAMSSSFQS
jgi:hypothetical protein